MSKLIRSLILCLAIIVGVAQAELDVHFLDVGQGDSTLIVCDGEAMLIDGGPSSASQMVFSYIRQQVEELDVVIATHPHDDHIGGLSAALNAVPVGVIYSPVSEWNSTCWANMEKYAEAQGTPIVVPMEGDTFSLGSAIVTIIHCWPEAWEENDMSIVLRLDYGETSFLFTGDAEIMSEEMMLGDGMPLKADVLKVAHHGSRYSSSPEFLAAVRPEWAVISCGNGNAYGHPNENVLQALSQATVLRTDQMGAIVLHSDGVALSVDEGMVTTADVVYIGNRKSMKFHRMDCESVMDMAEKNKVPLSTREDAIMMGFQPCGRCKP